MSYYESQLRHYSVCYWCKKKIYINHHTTDVDWEIHKKYSYIHPTAKYRHFDHIKGTMTSSWNTMYCASTWKMARPAKGYHILDMDYISSVVGVVYLSTDKNGVTKHIVKKISRDAYFSLLERYGDRPNYSKDSIVAAAKEYPLK